MACNKKINIVRDSKDNFCEFNLNNGDLILKNSNKGQVLLKKDILDYALDIDKDDTIHIIYLNSKDELNYCSYNYYNENTEETNVLIADDNYNIKYLWVKIINTDIHIFYEVGKLKGNVSSIYHNSFINGIWLDEEITKISCPTYICPYHIDYYKNNIYMLYCKDYNLGEYSIKKYDTKKSIWENIEENFIMKDANSLNFLVTPQNIAVICFSKFIKNNTQALISFKDLDNLNSKWSLDTNVSDNNVNIFKPVVFYKEDYCYIMWVQENKIIYKKSNDLMHWSNEIVAETKSENIYKALHLSNIYKNSNLKINHIYMSDVEFLLSMTKVKTSFSDNAMSVAAITSDVTAEDITIDNVITNNKINNDIFDETYMNLNENFIYFPEAKYVELTEHKDDYKDGYIETLINKLKQKDASINYLNEVNLSLTNEINDMRSEIDEYEDKLQNLRIKQIKDGSKCSNVIYNYENSIKILREEKDILSTEVNKKIEALLKIIEEKENIIQKLYNAAKNKI